MAIATRGWDEGSRSLVFHVSGLGGTYFSYAEAYEARARAQLNRKEYPIYHEWIQKG